MKSLLILFKAELKLLLTVCMNDTLNFDSLKKHKILLGLC